MIKYEDYENEFKNLKISKEQGENILNFFTELATIAIESYYNDELNLIENEWELLYMDTSVNKTPRR